MAVQSLQPWVSTYLITTHTLIVLKRHIMRRGQCNRQLFRLMPHYGQPIFSVHWSHLRKTSFVAILFEYIRVHTLTSFAPFLIRSVHSTKIYIYQRIYSSDDHINQIYYFFRGSSDWFEKEESRKWEFRVRSQTYRAEIVVFLRMGSDK